MPVQQCEGKCGKEVRQPFKFCGDPCKPSAKGEKRRARAAPEPEIEPTAEPPDDDAADARLDLGSPEEE